MKGLTKQELETSMEAENIIFSYLDCEVKKIYNDSAIAFNNLYSEKVGE